MINGSLGFATVISASKIECHAASYYSASDVSGKRINGVSARDKYNETIMSFFKDNGVLRYTCPNDSRCAIVATGGTCNRNTPHGKDIVNDVPFEWYPFASQGDYASPIHVEFSHIVSSNNGGAYCACNLVPELGLHNNARGDEDMRAFDSPRVVALLDNWRAWWEVHAAKKASLARLACD